MTKTEIINYLHNNFSEFGEIVSNRYRGLYYYDWKLSQRQLAYCLHKMKDKYPLSILMLIVTNTIKIKSNPINKKSLYNEIYANDLGVYNIDIHKFEMLFLWVSNQLFGYKLRKF